MLSSLKHIFVFCKDDTAHSQVVATYLLDSHSLWWHFTTLSEAWSLVNMSRPRHILMDALCYITFTVNCVPSLGFYSLSFFLPLKCWIMQFAGTWIEIFIKLMDKEKICEWYINLFIYIYFNFVMKKVWNSYLYLTSFCLSFPSAVGMSHLPAAPARSSSVQWSRLWGAHPLLSVLSFWLLFKVAH